MTQSTPVGRKQVTYFEDPDKVLNLDALQSAATELTGRKVSRAEVLRLITARGLSSVEDWRNEQIRSAF